LIHYVIVHQSEIVDYLDASTESIVSGVTIPYSIADQSGHYGTQSLAATGEEVRHRASEPFLFDLREILLNHSLDYLAVLTQCSENICCGIIDSS
jgi:hypothetical protein